MGTDLKTGLAAQSSLPPIPGQKASSARRYMMTAASLPCVAAKSHIACFSKDGRVSSTTVGRAAVEILLRLVYLHVC
jgi:hypothetical protein